ncbi:hypothetical protein D0T24_05235 [Duganella sp. BJB480]|uniref:hypothetical protein n=1 Tax=unclassified Duganella TaxID=2636909 RepID=UPI000E350D29|nr:MULTISPECIES: hypothetical protein [unclassified Duganella]RFP17557.1 hypothetical protein D0T26_15135 [Duganella sp. BJB489]RFP37401.1 hypothetical protein D0T24_05235 [Duganella sp. BJB480]
MNPHDHTEDAEFEDFLKGEGDLARRLHDLPQPQPPEALSAAILARAAADMRGAGAESANDALHDAVPAAPPARHYLRRARVPLGLAASAVFALFAVRVLMPQAVAPVEKEPVVVAAAPVEKAPPSAIEIESAPPPAPKAVQRKRSATRTTSATEIAAAADAERAAPSIAPSILAAPPIMAAPLAKRSAVFAAREESKQLVLQPEPGAEGPLLAAPAPLARAQAPMMSAAASKPRPMSYFGAAAEAPPAQEWLDRIAAMLKAGQTKEAQAEWLKFRMRYPDAEVPPELQRQLQAIN